MSRVTFHSKSTTLGVGPPPPPPVVVNTGGGWLPRTVTRTSAARLSRPALSSVTVRMMFWTAAVVAGAVHVVSGTEALSKLPPPLLLQAYSRLSPSGSVAVPRSVTSSPPFTVVGVVAVAVTAGARLARTVTSTVTVAARSA